MNGVIIKKEAITSRDTLYQISCGDASVFRPGQFVEVLVENANCFLRRPISVFDANKSSFTLLVRTVGKGTEQMLALKEGDEIDFLGPLGNGFQIDDDKKNILLVGGGIGCAPLNLLAKTLLENGKDVSMVYLPKRDAALMNAMKDLFEKMPVYYSENRGALQETLDAALAQAAGCEMVYSCGPVPMMEALTGYFQEKKIPLQLSMEERMGCGFGICSCCAIKIRDGESFKYKKVCKDGPVFFSDEIIF